MLCPHCRKPLTATVGIGQITVSLPDPPLDAAAIADKIAEAPRRLGPTAR